MVTVLDSPILRISNAFPSGSDQILKDFRPMLAKIARELKNDTSRIEVIGHMCDPL
jgi:type VI secretion system protein ImpK